MNAAKRPFSQALSQAAMLSSARLPHAPRSVGPFAQLIFRQSSRRYSSRSAPLSSRKTALYFGGASVVALAVAGYYYRSTVYDAISGVDPITKTSLAKQSPDTFTPTSADYQKVFDEIAYRLVEYDDYDDGSYGPVLFRLAWHCSGTYDAETGTGGSNGATMRFGPEGTRSCNAGLENARTFLEPVKLKFPWISYSDLWTLAGVCAMQEMQGPAIPWRPGRVDRDVSFSTPDGRLPDGSKHQDHVRAIFGRMGFDDRETVALLGGHSLGRCHKDRSGFEGLWVFSPTMMTNEYYRVLLGEKWQFKDWDGQKQYEDKATRSLMMLPTDMALIQDAKFRKHVERFANDSDVFFGEFSDAVCKLFELGVPFIQQERMTFKSSE